MAAVVPLADAEAVWEAVDEPEVAVAEDEPPEAEADWDVAFFCPH